MLHNYEAENFCQDVASLATMMNAGVSLVRAVWILEQSGASEETRKVMKRVLSLIESGETFTRALAKSRGKRWSSRLVVAFVRAGEVGGVLDETLDRLSTYYAESKAKEEIEAIRLANLRKATTIRLLGTLITSGVPILLALEVASTSTGDRKIKGILQSAKAELKEGVRLADCQPFVNLFDPFAKLFASMVQIGEETGALDAMLHKFADLYEAQCLK